MVVTPSGFAIYELQTSSAFQSTTAAISRQTHLQAPAAHAVTGKGKAASKPSASAAPALGTPALHERGQGCVILPEGSSSEPHDPRKERARLLELVSAVECLIYVRMYKG